MIGFEVALNGTRLCTASAGEKGVLSAMVTWVQRSAPVVAEPSDLSMAVGGLAEGSHLEWVAQRKLAVGDEVLVKIIETASSDPPVHARPVDRASNEAEERKYYERLKRKYEGK